MWGLDVWVCHLGFFLRDNDDFFLLCVTGGVRSARLADPS